jgi:hypothetical protein
VLRDQGGEGEDEERVNSAITPEDR